MKILVVSDTHGSADGFSKAVEAEHPDQVFHLGDIMGQKELFEEIAGVPVYAVKGNCDSFFSDLPEDLCIDIGRHRAYLAHGHRHDVRYSMDILVTDAQANIADVAIYGHTHVPQNTPSYNGVTIINPGSLTYPRQPAGQRTYAVIEVDDRGELRVDMKTIDQGH
ncbi:MAG: metallophosphoesterase [Lachnospiraceae bacterium]|nr:metallophosphoesterase [Lachnospiraceae bacterium]